MSQLEDSTNTRSWSGWGVHKKAWDWGDKGNHHMISKVEGDDTKDSLPAGTYLLEFDPDWEPFAEKYPVLKQITFRVSAAVPINADILTDEQTLSIMTGGNAKSYSKVLGCGLGE